MAKQVSPLNIYPLLPDDCESLFGTSKMAVATQLAGKKMKVSDVKEIYDKLPPEFAEKYEKLADLLSPAIREIEIGAGDKKIIIGGDDVMFRHTLSFYNKPPVAVDVWDTMSDDELFERINKIQSFQKFYVGDFLYLDMIAVRSTSGNPETFGKCVEKIIAHSDLPLILCTKDAKIMRAGLDAADGKNPLMYACDVKNRKEMTTLALEFDVPIVITAAGNLDETKSLSATLQKDGVSKIVIDPGTASYSAGFKKTFQNFIKLRKAGLDGDKDLAFPLIALPIAARKSNPRANEKLPQEIVADYHETITASALTVRYADIMIIHGLGGHELLPIVHVTDMIYTDPRTPSSVEPKLYQIGNPDSSSPVLFTTNFALTYYTVESDLASAGFDGYVLAVNTGGLGVEAAVAGGQLTAEVVKKNFEEARFNFEETDYQTLVLPGLAARLQNEIEKSMNIAAVVGPMDSGRLAKWLEENWPPEKKT
ncbi:acetyl-CoA decarbonylase/synthase complex subunit gamma [Methanimicrococcus blatticola]|uniref:Acetyl-CoA decarbonylase/synthase gamma subunit n=1 Tax=Methanimicrococcus blatticola TaxID=91560 RepID=A0A484F6H1_9EURY|nr:acetyl-CoA decarbonylase/synthase complex subunit gamma [Methanimicrococcus blatticola]MBZ3935641.1 acetyl-CoA decarbonylase/synthase complex subunit gamma [Methanimicrococcus blatticola]MCC2509283.1 acetyl-CoA decarbonylase/synthase complex subunit gamma [Methanimicrococcus blatticola]TDQ69353.1 acetyl-CoA decarbonylase/synthase gamma subunit [Methanimicrococcus blatticola]